MLFRTCCESLENLERFVDLKNCFYIALFRSAPRLEYWLLLCTESNFLPEFKFK